MSIKPEVAKCWVMSFRSLGYLVVFYYQAHHDKEGAIYAIWLLLTRPLRRLPL